MSLATAPAKVILLGEHAVVYGHPAIAMPFPALQARAEARAAERSSLRSERYPETVAFLDEAVTGELAPATEALRGAFEALERLGSTQPLALVLKSDIPAGAGLGSSAATAVACVRAAFGAHGREAPAALVRAIATRAEAIAHGASSGLDPAAVCAEAPIRFVRAHAPVPLTLRAAMGIVIALSDAPSATGPMVAQVGERQQHEAGAREALVQLGELSDQGAELFEKGELAELGGLMDRAHALLASLGVSTPALDTLCRAAREAGAWGAKLTGGGGGGCAVALCPLELLEPVTAAMGAAGASHVWPAQYLLERKQER